MVNRPAAPTGAASQSSAAAESEVLKQKKANETQQAVVLFIIVLASTYTSVSLHSGYFGRNSGTSFVRHRWWNPFPMFTRTYNRESTIHFEKILV